MDLLFARCAGLDVHKKTVVGCVRTPGAGRNERRSETKSFLATTRGLRELSEWLEGHDVTHVAMESTGVYWRPVYTILEGSFELLLVNARHVKMVPGRKTDVRDCEWLAQLLECGLLRGSFVPPKAIRDLRDLTRYRKVLIRERGHHVNRVAKTLELANIKLSSVVTDIMGKTGRAILDALIEGVDDVSQLADLARGSLRNRKAELREAVEGRMTSHYAFLLKQQLSMIDTLDDHIARLDAQIEESMRPFAEAYAYVMTMPGIAARAAQSILAETGVEMDRFPSPNHLASWARVCPGTHESGGKRKNVTTGRGNTWLRATLQEAAWAASRTKRSYYHALYHRLKARRGAKKAIVAVQHSMVVALWTLLSRSIEHQDLGHDYFDTRNKAGIRRHHVRRLRQLGYTVTLEAA